MAKKMKKLLALVLTIAMVLSFMSVGAFAAEPEPSCGVEAHEHTEGCYEQVLKCELTEGEDELICDKTVHQHGEGCSHTHDATCVGNTCGQDACTAVEHEHTDACHKHSDACTGKKCALTACTEEHEHNEECHLHTDDCRGNACALLLCVEDHEHTEDCHLVHTDDCTLNTCELEECDIEEHDHATAGCHQHNEECIGNTCGLDEGLICTTEVHAHGEDCYAPHVHGEDCYENKLTCEKAVHTHDETCIAQPQILMLLAQGGDYVAQIGEVGYETLAAAVADANKDTTTVGAVVIELLKDTTFDAAMTISRDIIIEGAYTITRADTYTGTLFTVAAGATLTLEDLTIDGGNEWTFDKTSFMNLLLSGGVCTNDKYYATGEAGAIAAEAPLIKVNGTVVLDVGATIKNHFGKNVSKDNANCPSVFYVSNSGTLITKESTLTHISKASSSAVVSLRSGGTWYIEEGSVISDVVSQGHGAVSYSYGDIYINGGEIYDTYSSDCNGSVFCTRGYIEMNGGNLHHNYALMGSRNSINATIYVYSDGKLVMNDGVLQNNYGSQPSGIGTRGWDIDDEETINVTLNGGKVIDGTSGRGSLGHDASFSVPVKITNDMIIGETRLYNDMINEATLYADVYFHGWYVGDPVVSQDYYGGGTIKGDVTVYQAAEVIHHEGSWNGFVTVDAVGNGTTLTVMPGATIDGIQVRVLDSVASGSDLDAEQAKTAQEASYVEKTGANVESPVLFYHRLTSDQKKNIVVTYDYNGGLDAQNWSGCQRTTAEDTFTTTPLPAPTREGYILAGWNYATDNDPESLSMAGNEAFEGEAITESVRLIAQWEKIKGETFTVTYKYIGTVPSGAPSVPTDSNEYEKGDTVNLAAEPTMEGYTFSGWNTDTLASGDTMPANNVIITGYWMEEKDSSLGIKTAEELDSSDNSYEVKIEVPGNGDGLHDEVIIMVDGSVSWDDNVPAWEATKTAILGVAETVLDGSDRTQVTLMSFGMSDNVFAEGITDVDELKAMLPEDSFGLLYGVSSSNFESSFTGIEEYIQENNESLNDVRVVCISNGGLNRCDIPVVFEDRDTYTWMTDTQFLNNALGYGLEFDLYGDANTDALIKVFGSKDDAKAAYDAYNNGENTAEFAAKVLKWREEVFAEIYEAAGMTIGVAYPISDLERAFLDYDNANGTCMLYMALMPFVDNGTYWSYVASLAVQKERTIAAAEKVAAMDLVSEFYVVQYGDDYRADWMQKIDGSNYFHYDSLEVLLSNLADVQDKLAVTNYKNVVVTDYMSKWVNLDTTTIRVVNDTTGETIWNNTNGWLINEGRPTAQATPVVVEKVDAADYAAGGEDVVGNTNGDIYKLTWYVKDDALLRADTYSLRYTVTVDTEEDGFLTGTDYPANGTTEVTYEDENGDDKKNDIEVPHVDVPGYTVTYINGNTIVQKDILLTGDAIPSGEELDDYTRGFYYYEFMGWRLTSGTEGANNTVGTTDLVYEAVFNREYIGDSYTDPTEEVFEDERVPLAGIPAAFREDHIAYIIGRDDGLVHPNANITRAEVATIFFRLLNDETREKYMTSVNYFTDVNEGDWFNNAVSTLNAMGIIYGRSAEIFDPNANITRAEFAAIAARFDPTASTEGGFFTDIDGHWAELEINMAANNGWVEGYEGLFRPDDEITRAEAMTMINRVLHRIPETEHDLLDYMVIWPDNMDIKKWYYLAVQEATNSHDYGRKENEYEYWTALQEVPDWAALEY